MPSETENYIDYIEQNTDKESAFFSFTTDETGENGVIKANKEGLRLYALELLKKAQELEDNPSSMEVLFFDEYEWLEDDAGYNLIWGVQPTGNREKTPPKKQDTETMPVETSTPVHAGNYRAINGWVSYPAVISGVLLMASIAAFKWFH